MLTAEARIDTATPNRYIAQFCRHATGMARGLAHRAAARVAGHPLALGEVQVRAEWSEDHGTVSFDPWGRCTMLAEITSLLLRVEATDAEHLRRIQQIVGSDLERFGWRDHLAVQWDPPDPPLAEVASIRDLHPSQRTGGTAIHDVGHHHRLLFATLGTLAIAVIVALHLAVAGAMAAVPAWLGWTAAGLVAVPGLIAVVHALAPITAVGLGRHALHSGLAGRRAMHVRLAPTADDDHHRYGGRDH